MLNLEWIWEPRNRTVVLLTSVGIVLVIAVVDWWTKPYVSLGFLYLFPIMLAAGFLPRWAIVLMGIACALLSERFSNLDPADAPLRTSFEALALVGSGLFISEVLRNRRLRLASQERLRVLVETSPAAIVTVDEHGFIELANHAAAELLAPRDGASDWATDRGIPARVTSRLALGRGTAVQDIDAMPRASRQWRVVSGGRVVL